MHLRNKLIKHKAFMDVCFQVVSQYEGSTHYKLKGYWVNMGFTKSFNIFPRTSNIEIDKTKVKDWQFAGNPSDEICYRKCNWLDF